MITLNTVNNEKERVLKKFFLIQNIYSPKMFEISVQIQIHNYIPRSFLIILENQGIDPVHIQGQVDSLQVESLKVEI